MENFLKAYEGPKYYFFSNKQCLVRALYLILFFLITFQIGNSQKEDHIWLLGRELYDTVLPDRAADTTRGSTNMDFNFDPVKVYYDPIRKWDLHGGNATICDTSGQIIAYSNGQVLVNNKHTPIEDTINYFDDQNFWGCIDWENNNLGDNNLAIPIGLLGLQRILILPMSNKYYGFYTTFDYCEQYINRLSYCTFEINENNPGGEIINKDRELLKVTKDSGIVFSVYAIRHGNGRDWWIVSFTSGNKEMITFLLDPTGVHYVERQVISELNFLESAGQITVSPDGNWLAWYVAAEFSSSGGGFCVSKFDRCTGKIIGSINHKILSGINGIGSGVSFSSDSRFLYVCNTTEIWQFDLFSNNIIESETLVATFDGYYEYSSPNADTNSAIKYRVNFWTMKLAPDGRIYIFSSSIHTRWLGVIESPTELGLSSNVKQHSLKMNTNISRVLPNIPEFRLGPLDASSCDTLGIDNHPIAKYRYEPDAIDHLRIRFTDLSYFRPETWSWDFGDGSPRVSMRHPYHSYAASGTYNVCLTVSNENSSNTSCRTITIGTSSVDGGISAAVADITLFPNPVDDYLFVTLGEYIPQHGQIMIYDISGRPVRTQRIYYGQNNVDMTQLASGMYVWKVMDGQVEIRSGKVVKI
jgi:hypothetical protein